MNFSSGFSRWIVSSGGVRKAPANMLEQCLAPILKGMETNPIFWTAFHILRK